MDKLDLNVSGMMCEGCENRIKKVINNIDGVTGVKVSYKDGKVIITGNGLNREELINKIENLDYEVLNK